MFEWFAITFQIALLSLLQVILLYWEYRYKYNTINEWITKKKKKKCWTIFILF